VTAQEIKHDDPVADAQTAAGRPQGRWGNRLAMGISAYHLGRQAWKTYQAWRERQLYTVTLMESDETYFPVQEWLLERMPEGGQRALMARTTQRRDSQPTDPQEIKVKAAADEQVARHVTLSYDGNRQQVVQLDGHQIRVHIEREEGGHRGDDHQYIYKPRKIVFAAQSLAGRQAVTRFLQGVADSLVADGRRNPRLIMASRWGSWQGVRHLQNRSLESVILPDGHLDAIMDDLTQFLGSEARYLELCQPWHRGYLFHGPPGTGKTSTARAIASALGLDVYYIPLSDLETNATLNELVSGIPERSVLLLEDVDVAHAATARDDARQGLTLDGLLNVLDGVATPHGLVVVMTTNNRDSLDDALVRPGRVHHELEMTYLTAEQAERLITQLTGIACRVDVDLGAGCPSFPKVSAAELVEIVVAHLHDPETAHKECLALLDDRADQEWGLGEYARTT